MKLSEIKVLDDGRVYLKNGYYLVPLPGSARDDTHMRFNLRRLMDDTNLATAALDTEKHYDGTNTFLDSSEWYVTFDAAGHQLLFSTVLAETIEDAIIAFYAFVEDCAAQQLSEAVCVAEAMESENGLTIGLQGGYYLEFSSMMGSNTNRYLIYRLMDEDVLGECSYTTNKWQDKSTFNIDISVTGDRYTQIYRAASLKHLKLAFIEWVERSLKSVVIDESMSVNSLFTRD